MLIKSLSNFLPSFLISRSPLEGLDPKLLDYLDHYPTMTVSEIEAGHQEIQTIRSFLRSSHFLDDPSLQSELYNRYAQRGQLIQILDHLAHDLQDQANSAVIKTLFNSDAFQNQVPPEPESEEEHLLKMFYYRLASSKRIDLLTEALKHRLFDFLTFEDVTIGMKSVDQLMEYFKDHIEKMKEFFQTFVEHLAFKQAPIYKQICFCLFFTQITQAAEKEFEMENRVALANRSLHRLMHSNPFKN